MLVKEKYMSIRTTEIPLIREDISDYPECTEAEFMKAKSDAIAVVSLGKF